MPTQFHAVINNASSTLAASHPIGETSITLATGTGPLFGSPSPSSPIRITVQRADSDLLPIFRCTGRTNDTLTGLTVSEGSTDRAYATGDIVEARATAATYQDIHDSINALEQGFGDIQLIPGPQGIQGQPGPKGDTGETGPQGIPGVVNADSPLAYSPETRTVSFVGPISKSDVTGLNSDLSTFSTHIASTTNPHGVTKAQVGLSNVDNTSDANKPVSTATASALALKANTSHTHAIGDVTNLQSTLDGKAAASHNHAAGDITSGTISTARLGSGTANSTKVLYGDSTWKDAPTGGGSATPGGSNHSLQFNDDGDLGGSAHFTHDPSTGETRYNETTTLTGPKPVFAVQWNANSSGNKFDALAYRHGYAGSEDGPLVAAVRLSTDGGHRGQISFMTGGDINGTAMKEAVTVDPNGALVVNYGLTYTSTEPIRLGYSNYSQSGARIEVAVDGSANKGLVLHANEFYADAQLTCMQVRRQGNLIGGIDNGGRWFVGSDSNLGASLGVQARNATEPTMANRAITSQTSPLHEWQASGGEPLLSVSAKGALTLSTTIPDSQAPNNSLFRSSDNLGALCWKDSNGVVKQVA